MGPETEVVAGCGPGDRGSGGLRVQVGLFDALTDVRPVVLDIIDGFLRTFMSTPECCRHVTSCARESNSRLKTW